MGGQKGQYNSLNNWWNEEKQCHPHAAEFTWRNPLNKPSPNARNKSFESSIKHDWKTFLETPKGLCFKHKKNTATNSSKYRSLLGAAASCFFLVGCFDLMDHEKTAPTSWAAFTSISTPRSSVFVFSWFHPRWWWLCSKIRRWNPWGFCTTKGFSM